MADLFQSSEQLELGCCAALSSTAKAENALIPCELECEAEKYQGLRKDEWKCGESARVYEVEGLLTSGRAALCEYHALYFAEIGYLVTPL